MICTGFPPIHTPVTRPVSSASTPVLKAPSGRFHFKVRRPLPSHTGTGCRMAGKPVHRRIHRFLHGIIIRERV